MSNLIAGWRRWRNLGAVVRLLWLTNLWTPYRHSLWNACSGAGLDVAVRVFARTETGRHWTSDGPKPRYDLGSLAGVSAPYGEGRLYTFRPRTLSGLDRADAVLLGGWESPAYLQAGRGAERGSLPTIGFYESNQRSQRFRRGPAAARKTFFRGKDVVLSVGSASTDPAAKRRRFGRPDHHHCNSVDGKKLSRSVATMRERTNRSQGHRRHYLGQLIARKQPEVVLKAFERVARPADRLDIAGAGTLEGDLHRLITSRQLDHRVQLWGHLDGSALESRLASAHTLAMPSLVEAWGRVLSEALSVGMHAIVSTASGVAPAAAKMRRVYLARPDVGSTANAMALSRSAWTGCIENPKVLSLGPAEQASGVICAAEVALARHVEQSTRRRLRATLMTSRR
jgi:glycosyltransferase involved in cell wall biosynthesis